MGKNIKTSKVILTTLYLGILTLPFTAVAIKCGYVLLNKNAYQNYSTSETIEKAINTTPTSETIENNKYYNIEFKYTNTLDNEEIFKEQDTYETLELIKILPNVNNQDYDYNNINFYKIKADFFSVSKPEGATNINLTIDDIGETTTSIKALNINILVKILNIDNLTETAKSKLKPLTEKEYIYTSEMVEKTNLDNVFYTAIDELSNKSLFEWTKNTIFYNTINNLTTNLKISSDTIPVVLTYWITITLIYIIINLVVSSITILTEIINQKIGNKK